MSSYIWRSTGEVGSYNATTKQGTRAAALLDLIVFSNVNVTDGAHIHQTEFNITIAIGDNEKPQGDVNELQDVGVDSITWTITGSVESPTTNSVFQLVKKWMLEGKTDAVFTKGRFGLELDDIDAYDLVPTGTGGTKEQPRGYIISNWHWVKSGQTAGKVEFIATLRFNGNIGSKTSTITSPAYTPYSWTVNYA